MKAMVFAAGLGTRLKPFTNDRPKALAEVDGKPLLEIVLERLRAAGVTEVVINLHHFGEQIEAFMAQRQHFGLTVHYSREPKLLDTGGGLQQAACWLAGTPDDVVLLHNVDVLSDVDLQALVRQHRESGAVATLVAKSRETARPLLFDSTGVLCGRVTSAGTSMARTPRGAVQPLGFCGIHAISCRLLPRITETGVFSIIDTYLRLAATEESIRVFRADGSRWRDAGRPADLRALD